MKIRWLIGAGAAAMFLCQAAARADTFTVVGTITAGGTLQAANFPLAHGVPLSTAPGQYWKIQVEPSQTGSTAYSILFGPDPSAAAGSIGTGIIREISSSQELAVLDGAAYFVGQHPYGGSEGGSGSGTGTAFIVQGRTDGAPDRFVFLEGDDLTVSKKTNSSKKKTLEGINEYLEIADDADPSKAPVRYVKDLAATDAMRQMIWKIVDLAGKAGLNRPVPYGQ